MKNKPTIEEVKEHFKNAKEVKFCNSNIITELTTYNFNYNDSGGINEFCINGDYLKTKRTYHCVWSKEKGYAEIISYKEDSIVERVINQFKERSEAGIKKYGTTLDRNDLNTLEWINHAQQEAMDFVLYLEKLKSEYMK